MCVFVILLLYLCLSRVSHCSVCISVYMFSSVFAGDTVNILVVVCCCFSVY